MAMPFKSDERTDLTVEYGDNVEGTGFASDDDDLLGSSEWNLNTLPMVSRSMLRLLKGAIPGVTEPMLYIGMLFSTFSWHIEDLYLYSINYHHAGAPKTWYGVPSSDADAFEKVTLSKVYKAGIDKLVAEGMSREEAERKALAVLQQKTTIFSPEHLLAGGVRTSRCTQHAGEFVLTFPRAYHSGFSNGYNVGEAVNFALRDWFPYGADCAMRSRYLRLLQAVPLEQLLCLEMEVLHSELKGKAGSSTAANDSGNSADTSSPAGSSSDFGAWLSENGASALSACERPLVTTFCQLSRWQHRRTHALLAAGAKQTVQQFDNSVPCSRCRDMCYLSFVMRAGSSEPFCLRCCQQPPDPQPSETPNGTAAPANGEAAPPHVPAPAPVVAARTGTPVQAGTPRAATPRADARDLGVPAAAPDLTVFCHHKLSMYHKLGATYGALARSQSWGLSEAELKAGGLTDRLQLPRVCSVERDDYTNEDVNEEYDWHATAVRSPNSCKSDTDTLALLDAPLEGSVIGVLNELLPKPAVELPPLPPVKGRAQGGKAGRPARKALPRAPAPLPVVLPSPAVRCRKPSAASLQYAADGGDTELSGSLNASLWPDGDVGDDDDSVVKADVRRRKSQPSPKPNVRALDHASSLSLGLTRGASMQQDDEPMEEAGGRGHKRRAAANAEAMWKVGRISPEDALAADDVSRQNAKKRKAATSGSKRSEEHSGDSNLHPKQEVMYSMMKQESLSAAQGRMQWPIDGLAPNAMVNDPQGRNWIGSPGSTHSGGGNGGHMRGSRGPHPEQTRADPWLTQLESSAGLNNELAKLLDYFCNLPPVERSHPPGGTALPPGDASGPLDINPNMLGMPDQMGGYQDRRRGLDMHRQHSQQAPQAQLWAGPGHPVPPSQRGSRGDLQMMAHFLDGPGQQPPPRGNSQMLGHMGQGMGQAQLKMSDVDPLSMPFIGNEPGPQSPASPSQGRGRPRSRQGNPRGRGANSGGGMEHPNGLGGPGGQKGGAGVGADQSMPRGRGKLANSPVNMPSLSMPGSMPNNLSMPGSMEMNVGDFADGDTGDFTDFMKLLNNDANELEGIGL